MKTISLICAAAALCVPALAAGQRGGGTGAAGIATRGAEIQRVDRGATINLRRDVVVARGDVVTGTRIRRPLADPARRRWYNAHHHQQARRRWNAANPPVSDPSRRRAGD